MKVLKALIFCGFFFTCYPLSCFCQPKYEFRGVWISTVTNVDWPSEKGLSSEDQKQEFINLLDKLQHDGINAVVVQVRPSADAFYPSQYEPWSEYLTGTQGEAPDPYYDPLQFMIDEAHKRGMEFHAWINPYRAVFNIHTSSVSSDHITKRHPEWFLTYGDRKYFNPGLPVVMEYVTDIVRDIIGRYDVDGIHVDDYFYPYPINGKEFPDNAAYNMYGHGLSKAAWRRSNCDSVIKRIHDVVLDTKPGIKFGVSPFGIWRNKQQDPMGSDTKVGNTSSYDDLYADILLWLQKGWIDYVAPQIYWEIGNPSADYETLVKWWSEHTYGKQLLIGHGISKALEKNNRAWKNTDELPDEIKMLRDYNNVQGSVYFSSSSLMQNPNGWGDSLHDNYYKYPALIPPAPWIDTSAPSKPDIVKISEMEKGPDSLTISGQEINKTEEIVKNYVLYISDSIQGLGLHPLRIIGADKTNTFKFTIPRSWIPADRQSCFMAVSSVDRENNESDISNVVEYRKPVVVIASH